MSQPNSPNSVKQEQKDFEIIEVNENQILKESNGTDKELGKKNAVKKSEPKVSVRSKTLWKLVRMKYIPRLEFRLCRTCSNILFHSTSRVIEREGTGGVVISFELCKQCVDLNMHVKDVLCDWTLKKKEVETNTKQI
uniref:Uncharacterized protein n=1 Tax=Meloidogyne hapla TaxID=6305 RepID=A0A1I8B0Z0_MELHA